jgi:hypothetical protein
MHIKVEHTDTFGGEANYCWVNRQNIYNVPDTLSDVAIVRRAKSRIGYSGRRCTREEWGNTIVLRPVGENTIIFIDVGWEG